MAATTILGRAGETLGVFLPRLAGALALLVIGVLVALLVGRVVTRALRGLGVDDLAERGGVHDVIARAGLGRSLAAVLGVAIRLALTVVVVFAALSLLGLQLLSQSLNQGVQLLPSLLIGAALVLMGIVLGGFVRGRVDRLTYQLDLPVPLGTIAQVTVVSVFLLSAAAQLAISTSILVILVGILVAAAAAMFALAFGLGGRELARSLSAGRYVSHAFEVGQEITIGDVRGRITAIESASTVLDGGVGDSLRIPNHLLLEAIVTVHGDRETSSAG